MVTVKASSLAATGGRRQVWSYPKDSLPRESFLFDLSGCSSPILKVCLYLTGLRTCSTWTAYHQCFSKTIGGNHLTSELSEMGIQAKWEYKVGYATGWPKDSKKKKKKKSMGKYCDGCCSEILRRERLTMWNLLHELRKSLQLWMYTCVYWQHGKWHLKLPDPSPSCASSLSPPSCPVL